jgi:hypothetical protein
MFTQAKAAVALKDKKTRLTKTRLTKTRLTKERKEEFINLCLLTKKRDRTINLKQFHDSEPELKAAIGYSGWVRVVAKDPRIAHAFGTKHKNVDGNQDAPPPPGIFMDEDGDEYVYTCRCSIHKSLVEIPSRYCDKCQSNVIVWKHQKLADDALETLMKSGNNLENFEWPEEAEQIKATTVWESIGCINQPYGDAWKHYLETLPEFHDFLEHNIKVRQLTIPSRQPLNHKDETCGARCPATFSLESQIWNWNPKQVLDNPHDDDAFRLATFANGDYACIGTIPIPDELIFNLAKKESPIIAAAGFKK